MHGPPGRRLHFHCLLAAAIGRETAFASRVTVCQAGEWLCPQKINNSGERMLILISYETTATSNEIFNSNLQLQVPLYP